MVNGGDKLITDVYYAHSTEETCFIFPICKITCSSGHPVSKGLNRFVVVDKKKRTQIYIISTFHASILVFK